MTLRILRATAPQEIEEVRTLLHAYAEWRGYDKALGQFDNELQSLPGEYAPPAGVLLLARQDDRAAGCLGLRPLSSSIAELKRMYVDPEFRGNGIGEALLTTIIQEATLSGYRHLRLDTHPQMRAARRLYRRFGFEEIPPYNQNPTPGIRFFERFLSGT